MVEFRSNDPYRDTSKRDVSSTGSEHGFDKVRARKKKMWGFFFFCCVQPHALQNYIDLHGLKSFSKEL